MALAGCIQTLHPLYTENDLTFDAALIGVWGEDNSKETWAFEKEIGRASCRERV